MLDTQSVHLIKLGGSLLRLPDLPERLKRWESELPANPRLFVIGGGALVDVVRAWHTRRPLPEVTAHAVCIDLMHINARMLAAATDLPILRCGPDLEQRLATSGAAMLDVPDFMQRVEPHAEGAVLPASWEVTSDSIAARAAIVMRAPQLTILKSADPPEIDPLAGDPIRQYVQAGYLDVHFSNFTDALPCLKFVNLASR